MRIMGISRETGAPKPASRAWQQLLAWLNVLAMSGIDKTTDAVMQRKIMLVNISALVAVGGTVVYAGIYLPRGVWGLTASALLQAVLAVFYCAVWPMNRRGFFRAARYHFLP